MAFKGVGDDGIVAGDRGLSMTPYRSPQADCVGDDCENLGPGYRREKRLLSIREATLQHKP